MWTEAHQILSTLVEHVEQTN
ncbi:hypothetical protein ACTIVE_8885 [Actinomadura verrucosospora]|uniref:Uncharacterized protein n=1 Tax=Actinomadura verrucosospora TaxID=46165 RepID=A0A7D3W618_ACTVE|nr:hypothetical protein ACTIVE_8885 [Actinomadura verrucosospora]